MVAQSTMVGEKFGYHVGVHSGHQFIKIFSLFSTSTKVSIMQMCNISAFSLN